MAIEIGTETVAVTTQERTWRINIETPCEVVPTVTVFREVVKSDPNGVVISKAQGILVTRQADAVAGDSFSADGVSVTGAQLTALIALAVDQWRQEDIAAAAA
ncbi:hypothetical protein [Bradyrhizobium prioriisuperbiae]|uniref:hypothetical protein n=1 Tax=Bradyrhizobium prioriisuperbiae TaxID=2854389 RepID=UPI0028E45A63|nr:hypothetical protein [Bradyrhizobium prioritasuperba]